MRFELGTKSVFFSLFLVPPLSPFGSGKPTARITGNRQEKLLFVGLLICGCRKPNAIATRRAAHTEIVESRAHDTVACWNTKKRKLTLPNTPTRGCCNSPENRGGRSFPPSPFQIWASCARDQVAALLEGKRSAATRSSHWQRGERKTKGAAREKVKEMVEEGKNREGEKIEREREMRKSFFF